MKEREQRDIKELLILVRSKLLSRGLEDLRGLCGVVSELRGDLEINWKEGNDLKQYIYQHQPINWRTIVGLPFFWKPGRVKPRVKWLNKHIRK